MCRKEEVTYEILSDKCRECFISATGRTAKATAKEHLNGLKMKRETVLWCHCKEKHDSKIVN